ncbi:MAG: 5'-nucleotidase C-terminal domain-containing protein, partial [Hyphomicrobiales bacterium]|nr:5'-nucleotidase C-terminal domain-containing protein [Hyphomicrobiales bacterium]
MALGPGSIAFIGFNADGNDNLAFLAIDEIPAGTTIHFSDNEWNGLAIGAGGAFNSGESAFRFTATTAIAPGTVVTIDNIGTGTVSSNIGAVAFTDSTNRGLAAGGDTVYAYLAPDASPAAPTAFLTAFSNGSFSGDGTIANTGLTAGLNALAFDTDADILAYNGPRSGETSLAAYAPLINTAANWITEDGSGDQHNNGTAPDIPFSTAAFSATGGGTGALTGLSASSASTAEGGSLTFTVTLDGPAPVDTVVTLSAIGDIAIPASVTIPAGQSSANFTGTAADNTEMGPNPPAQVTAALGAANFSVPVTITDNDDYTHIYTIQGTGAVSAFVGQSVTTRGVVTAVDTNGGDSSRGFYIQDVSGDGNDATSDAIFVFRSSGAALPQVGRLVEVTGTISEFTPSSAASGSFSLTQFGSSASWTDLGAGSAITPVQIGGPGGRLPPTADLAAGAAFFESLESMVVTVKAPIAVGPTNNFGEIYTVVDNDADASNGIGGATGLTERGNLLLTPGAPSFGKTDTAGGDFNPERIQIDADSGLLPGFTKPVVDVGAQLSDVTGVVAYAFGNYEVLATTPYSVTNPSPLVRETGTLNGASNKLLIASYNAENLDPKIETQSLVQNGSASNVDDDLGSGKFDTIANQIFATLNAPDIVALQEIQDSDGAEITGTVSASVTLQTLVDKINALAAASGSPAHYAFIDHPFLNNNAAGNANGGQPGGNIRAAFLYREDRVSFDPASLRTVGPDGESIVDLAGNASQATDPDHPFYGSRPPLAATFTFNGETVTVINNHFSSKGGSQPLLGSAQPPANGSEVQRAAQAQAVNSFIDALLANDPDANVVVAGDLNEFPFEQPMSVLKGEATISGYDVPGTDPGAATATYTPGGTAILTDLGETLPESERFDYVFEGNSQTLDHILVTNNLTGRSAFDVVRVNADFGVQTSDHDPLLAAIQLGAFRIGAGETVTETQILHDTDQGVVEAGGTLAVTATGTGSATAILWTGGTSSIENGGIIRAAAGSGASRAIDSVTPLPAGSTLTITNLAGAEIVSNNDDAIRIRANIPDGRITIDNAGAIVSGDYAGGVISGTRSGQAIDLNSLTAPTIATTIVNASSGVIGAANADAIRTGINATVENSGVIVALNGSGGSNSDAIDFQDNGTGTVTNLDLGSITGARHGITGGQAILVQNLGAGATITGQRGSGINLDTAADSLTTIVNKGTITGTASGTSDGDGIDVDGLVDLDNEGLVEALGTATGALNEGLAIGGGSVTNHATGVIRSTERAITVDDSDLGEAFGAITITNFGLIEGGNGEAIAVAGGRADLLVNHGTIAGSVDLGGGADTFNLHAGSSISGMVNGGAGADTANLLGTGAGLLDEFTGIETIRVHGGEWTLGSEGFETLVLEDGAQALAIDGALLADGAFAATITGFGTDDRITLAGIGTAATATLGAGNLLTLAGGSLAGPVTLQLDPALSYAGKTFSVSSDSLGGTNVTVSSTFQLQLLHFADGEAGLLALDTAKNLAAMVDAFDDDYANTLILAGGDNWLPGPFLAAGTDTAVRDEINAATGSTMTGTIPIAAADIAIHNLIGVEASAIGNHEFDLGSNVLASSLSPNSGWTGAQFVSVSANLVVGPSSPYYTNPTATDSALNGIYVDTVDFNVQPALNAAPTTTNVAEASTLKGKIAPATVITKGGEKIGIVGATTQILETISSPSGAEIAGFPGGPGANGEADNMDLLAAQLQPIIDELIAEGVNKIVLMAHLQVITNEIALASKLRGVDIILSAGSNTRFGDSDDVAVEFPGHAADFAYTYPLATTGADGKTTLIVNTDNEYTYLGRLVVEFDENGDILVESLTANQAVNGAYASTDENVAAAWGTSVDQLDDTAFAAGTKGGQVASITDAVGEVIAVKDGNVFGYSNVYLEGERNQVRAQETNLGNLTADANAWKARTALDTDIPVVSIKNGGGIRAQIGTISAPDPVDGTVDKLPPEGGVSQLDIENALRFDNRLMVFDTTPQGLLNIFNFAANLATAGANGTPVGGFPQIGGLAFSFDPTKPENARIVSMGLLDEFGNVAIPLVRDGVVLPGAPALISVVTLNFTANGGDGWPIKANGENFRYLLNDGTLSAPIDKTLNFTAAANIPANTLGEQKAFADFLQAFHSTPETAFGKADTPASEDLRIENLAVRSDAIIPADAQIGTKAGETILGDGGDNTIFAQGGDDDLDGGAGDDMLNGGAG